MSEITTNDAQSAYSTAERLDRLQGRAELIGGLPILSQAGEARKIVTEALGVLADLARDVEKLQPYVYEEP